MSKPHIEITNEDMLTLETRELVNDYESKEINGEIMYKPKEGFCDSGNNGWLCRSDALQLNRMMKGWAK